MTVGQLKKIISVIPDDVEVEADTQWECGPVPLGKGYLIEDSLIFIHDGLESQEREYEAKLKAEQSKCMDLPKVSFHGAGNAEGQEMSETVHKVVADMEYKFEIGAIIALLRKLLTATWDFNIAHRKHIGVMVEDVLNFLIDAMEEELEKEEKETDEDG